MSRYAVGRMVPWMAAALLVAFWVMAVWPTGAKAANGEGLTHLLTDPLDSYENVTSYKKTYRRDGWNRNVLVMKPIKAVGTAKPPVFVILHYRGGSAKDMANLIEIGRLVRDHGAWAVLPDALSGQWRKDPGQRTSVDDVGFIDAALTDVLATGQVDSKRVYIAGFSDGAFMSLRYACERSGRIAGGMSVSGAVLKSLANVCAPTHSVPFTFINGTSDTRVMYNGSMGVLSAPDSALFWASMNGCTVVGAPVAIPDIAADGTTSTKQEYSTCLEGKDVDFYTVNRGGHTWPGVAWQFLLGRTSYDFSATDAAWEFFQRFALP